MMEGPPETIFLGNDHAISKAAGGQVRRREAGVTYPVESINLVIAPSMELNVASTVLMSSKSRFDQLNRRRCAQGKFENGTSKRRLWGFDGFRGNY